MSPYFKRKTELTENGNFLCYKFKTEMANFRSFAANGNEKNQKFALVGKR
jgi:hypothetical protein